MLPADLDDGDPSEGGAILRLDFHPPEERVPGLRDHRPRHPAPSTAAAGPTARPGAPGELPHPHTDHGGHRGTRHRLGHLSVPPRNPVVGPAGPGPAVRPPRHGERNCRPGHCSLPVRAQPLSRSCLPSGSRWYWLRSSGCTWASSGAWTTPSYRPRRTRPSSGGSLPSSCSPWSVSPLSATRWWAPPSEPGAPPRVHRLRHFRLGVVMAVTSAVVRHAELARQSHVTT